MIMMKPIFILACCFSFLGCATNETESNTLEQGISGTTAKNAPIYTPPKILPYVVPVKAPMAQLSPKLSPDNVRESANLVADWQINNYDAYRSSPLKNFQGFERHSFGGWLMGTMAIGMTRWGLVEGNEGYLDFIRQEANKFNWNVESRVFDADDYMIGQTYLELFEKDRDASYLEPLTERLDYLYKNWPTVNNHSFGDGCIEMDVECRERWTWIDALFMGAPVWVQMSHVTGDKKYLDYGSKEYWDSFETFWDPVENLLYRDKGYIPMRDKYGEKVFWSRGNGWVYASFGRIIPVLPEGYPGYEKFTQYFRLMSQGLASLQQSDGSWSSSLTSPNLFPGPENSGSAFFVYGMAWGINNGLLEKDKYLQIVKKGWSGLVNSIYADGRLAYVQPSGSGPQTVHKESTDNYGVGAFLLAASEVYRLAQDLEETK